MRLLVTLQIQTWPDVKVTYRLEFHAVFRAELCKEPIIQAINLFTAHHVTRNRVRNDFNNPASRSGSYDSVREGVQVKTSRVEDALENANQLECEHVLATIITDFED